MITVTLDADAATAALARLHDPRVRARALGVVAQLLLSSTRSRFLEGRDPEGRSWRPNSPVTIERWLLARLGRGLERGLERPISEIPKRFAPLAKEKRPLIAWGRLSTDWHWHADEHQAVIWTPVHYAAVHQFGAKRGQFGRDRYGRPIPWGDIPPRPFLGLSDRDHASIADAILSTLVGD